MGELRWELMGRRGFPSTLCLKFLWGLTLEICYGAYHAYNTMTIHFVHQPLFPEYYPTKTNK